MKRHHLLFICLLQVLMVAPSLFAKKESALSLQERMRISSYFHKKIQIKEEAVIARVQVKKKGANTLQYKIKFPGSKLGLQALVTENEDIIIRDIQKFRRDTLRKEEPLGFKHRSALIQVTQEESNSKVPFKLNDVKRKFKVDLSTMSCHWGKQVLWSYQSEKNTLGTLTFKAPFSPIQAFELLLAIHKRHKKGQTEN